MLERDRRRGAAAHERVQHRVAGAATRKDARFDQGRRELGEVSALLGSRGDCAHAAAVAFVGASYRLHVAIGLARNSVAAFLLV